MVINSITIIFCDLIPDFWSCQNLVKTLDVTCAPCTIEALAFLELLYIKGHDQLRDLFYVPIPKVACTTLKHLCFYIQNKKQFENFVFGTKKFSIHTLSPTVAHKCWKKSNIMQDHAVINLAFKFCVVRNPVKRLLSCYSNRVLYHNDLKHNIDELKSLKLSVKPSLDEFVDQFQQYFEISPSIYHHARPMCAYLSRESSFYHKIYDISEIDGKLMVDLSNLCGVSIPRIPKLQAVGIKINVDDLTNSQISKIKKFYHDDYKFYGDSFIE